MVQALTVAVDYDSMLNPLYERLEHRMGNQTKYDKKLNFGETIVSRLVLGRFEGAKITQRLS
jgi:hypothetical protein